MNMLKRITTRIIFIKLVGVRCCSNISLPDFDTNYYCDNKNLEEIQHNISVRKGVGDINKVLELYNMVKATPESNSRQIVIEKLSKELSSLPNRTHPSVKTNVAPSIKHFINEKIKTSHKLLEFSEITQRLNLMRTEKLGNTCGHKSYYFLGELAELEEALIKYTVTKLLNENFMLVSVPDILPRHVLESCGMAVTGDRTQIYSLDPQHHGPDLYLSGTAEMSLAGLLRNTKHKKQKLPLKLAAVSRCYRAETSNVIEERGIYRVHQFTKVEMFAVTTPDQSDEMLEYILKIQEELFRPLGLHMQVLDMPPHELGAPAYRCIHTAVTLCGATFPSVTEQHLIAKSYLLKYDIEAWMPGRNAYGEISSCSNCTDYQSRRLNIKYDEVNNYVHTLNGTACAVPRVLIALLETHQHPKGKIIIPHALQPFMNGKEDITKNSSVPELKLLKIKR